MRPVAEMTIMAMKRASSHFWGSVGFDPISFPSPSFSSLPNGFLPKLIRKGLHDLSISGGIQRM